MAIHASLSWRNSRKRRILNRSMAIMAVDTVVSNVMSVAELDGLFARGVCSGQVRRPLQLRGNTDHPGNGEDRSENTNSGDCIRTAMKYLSHLLPRSKTSSEAVD